MRLAKPFSWGGVINHFSMSSHLTFSSMSFSIALPPFLLPHYILIMSISNDIFVLSLANKCQIKYSIVFPPFPSLKKNTHFSPQLDKVLCTPFFAYDDQSLLLQQSLASEYLMLHRIIKPWVAPLSNLNH